MARPLRIDYPGAYYHITARGVGRQKIFFEESDRQIFLGRLKETCERWGIIIHGYCLMSNHYHLEVETPEGNLSKAMQWLNQVYAGHINRTHGRAGYLFQGRFKSVLVEGETHLHALTRYIHLNPVRACIVKRPLDYKWSSYHIYLGLKKQPAWLVVSKTLERFGQSKKEQWRRYREFVEEGIAENPLKEMVFGAILGTKEFIGRIRKKLKNGKPVKDDREISGLISARPRPGLEEICELVAKAYGISKKELRVKGRKRNEIRDAAIFLSREYTRCFFSEIGDYYGGIGPPAVSLACTRVMEGMNSNRGLKKIIRQIKIKSKTH